MSDSDTKNDLSDTKLNLLKESYASNAGAITSADNKASFQLLAITLVLGIYSAFILGNIPTSSNTYINCVIIGVQLLFGVSMMFNIIFSVSVVWPRFNIDKENTLKAPQILFFRYVANNDLVDTLRSPKNILHYFFPVFLGKRNDESIKKTAFQKKLDEITKDSSLLEYTDQVWELAQIADRKMLLVRGATIWFILVLISFVLELMFVQLHL